MSDYLDPNNEELLKDFFAEAEQQVEQLESNVLVIENDPSNHEAIDEIFRAAHTLKGGSATVEMMELSHFTHTVEDVEVFIRKILMILKINFMLTFLKKEIQNQKHLFQDLHPQFLHQYKLLHLFRKPLLKVLV